MLEHHDTELTIVGAGPYGLALSAHAKARGISHRILGDTMASWRDNMPVGMFLKSEGSASNISHPNRQYSLRDYCRWHGVDYADVGLPVSLETFVKYGQWFAELARLEIENERVLSVERLADSGFLVSLERGSSFTTRSLVVATGTTGLAYIPECLLSLGPDELSHSSDYGDLGSLRQRDVAVIGAGQAALETATLLAEQGSRVQLVVRSTEVCWNGDPVASLRLSEAVRQPLTDLGRGWRNFFFMSAPGIFHNLEPERRRRLVTSHLGPAGASWLHSRAEGKFEILLCCEPIGGASLGDGRVRLDLASRDTGKTSLEVDHIVSATGFRPSPTRLSFLPRSITEAVLAGIPGTGYPSLSANFESSVPGLYFVGLLAAGEFGPPQRFVCGARYASTTIVRALHRRGSRRAVASSR